MDGACASHADGSVEMPMQREVRMHVQVECCANTFLAARPLLRHQQRHNVTSGDAARGRSSPEIAHMPADVQPNGFAPTRGLKEGRSRWTSSRSTLQQHNRMIQQHRHMEMERVCLWRWDGDAPAYAGVSGRVHVHVCAGVQGTVNEQPPPPNAARPRASEAASESAEHFTRLGGQGSYIL